ncbi:sialidase family protein [Succinivibrio dextrinosolvens]|nr:sialidase family protein [Succinivibrio dextrinosolvens]
MCICSSANDGTMYENAVMNTVEALLPPGPYRTAHSPAILELPNKDLLCCWFAGSFEGSPDVSIVCASLKYGDTKWSEPVQVSSDPERSEQNPSLFFGPDNAVWCMYTAQKARTEGKDNMQYTSQVRCQKSTDGGKSWSKYETMFAREGTFCRQPIQVLKSGRWIFSNWLCTDSPEGLSGDPTAFQISDDKGKTWRQVDMPQSSGRVHANVVELEESHLIAFMRSREADFIYRSESQDNGDSWSAPVPTPLPNNNSSISAIKLKSGRIAIAYNPTCTPNPQKGKAAWPGLRCPVAIALSEDGGKSFPLIRNIELGQGYVGEENRTNNKQYEYPYLMQSSDGMLHLAYAYHDRQGIKYVTLSEESVAGKKREKVVLYNPTSAKVS